MNFKDYYKNGKGWMKWNTLMYRLYLRLNISIADYIYMEMIKNPIQPY